MFGCSFVTYRSCRHLDNKHTVFGKVVGGLETLQEMEKIEVDNKDRPIEDIVVVKAQVFVDPFAEADEQVTHARFIHAVRLADDYFLCWQLQNERLEEQKKASEEEARRKRKADAQRQLKAFHSGIGKYINPSLTANRYPTSRRKRFSFFHHFNRFSGEKPQEGGPSSSKRKKNANYQFNFSSW